MPVNYVKKQLCDVCETKVLRICWILRFCGNSLSRTSIFLVCYSTDFIYFLFFIVIHFICLQIFFWVKCFVWCWCWEEKWFICFMRAMALGAFIKSCKTGICDLCINAMWCECIPYAYILKFYLQKRKFTFWENFLTKNIYSHQFIAPKINWAIYFAFLDRCSI